MTFSTKNGAVVLALLALSSPGTVAFAPSLPSFLGSARRTGTASGPAIATKTTHRQVATASIFPGNATVATFGSGYGRLFEPRRAPPPVAKEIREVTTTTTSVEAESKTQNAEAPTVPWFDAPTAQVAQEMKKSKSPLIRYVRLHGGMAVVSQSYCNRRVRLVSHDYSHLSSTTSLLHRRLESMMRKTLLRAVERGVTQIQCEVDEQTREQTLNGMPMVDLGTLGSLGLSRSQRYKDAIVDAIYKYDTTTFPTSSQWIRHPLWVETTKRVERVFNRPVVLTRSTGLANMAFFSSFIRLDPRGTGGIIMDKDAHASLRLCGSSIGGIETSATLKRTFDVDELETHVEKLTAKNGNSKDATSSSPIWYVLDGMVSITGEIPDVLSILKLQRKYPNLWIFCDDAHGTGWSGKKGRGYVTDQIIQEADTNANGYAAEAKRWIMSVCFGKSLGADGGALVLPNEDAKDFVHAMSPFCTFTCTKFPVADLALINEAMKMSLDGTIDQLQEELQTKVRYLHRRAREVLGEMVDFGGRSGGDNGGFETPVLFVPIDRPTETFFDIVETLQQEGIFVATCAPPATSGFGVRITVQRESSAEDIDRVLERIRDLLRETEDPLGFFE